MVFIPKGYDKYALDLINQKENLGSIDELTANGKRTKKEIAQKMLLYTKAKGKELPGLVRRRKAEQKLFLSK